MHINMSSGFAETILNISFYSATSFYNAVIQNTTKMYSHPQTIPMNVSGQHGCIELESDEMDYVPWDNPDNIVSAKVELLISKIKDNMLALLFLIGVPANVFNMVVFYKQGLKDRVNLCLFALSLADELYLIGAMLHHGEYILYLQFTSKEHIGPMFTFLMNTNLAFLAGFFTVSAVLSGIIASERCICILYPLKFQTLLRTKTMAVIIVVVYIVILGLFFIVAFRYRIGCVYDPVSGAVINTFVVGEFYTAHQEFIDFLDAFVFGLGLPGFVMMLVITTTTITTVKLRQVMTWRAGTSSSISLREVALTRMLIGNSIFFIICVSPVCANRFSWLFFPEINAGGRHHNYYLTSLWITDFLTFVNATFNIFVYYIMGSRYRETFWTLFGRKVHIVKA